MAIDDPARKSNSALGRNYPAALTGSRLRIEARAATPMALVSAWPDSVDKAAAAMGGQGYALPRAPGQTVRGDAGHVAHCQAPGRWLVELVDGNLPKLPPELGTVTDLSHARSAFTFEGENAVELAQKLAPIDFSLPRNGPMHFVQSGSDHSVSFALWRETADRFVVYVERSFGRDFWHTLEAESAEFRR